MHVDIHRCWLLFIGCFIRLGFALECLQCTSPVRRGPHNSEHSCLEGTISPLPCKLTANQSETQFQLCVSAVHKSGNRKNLGVVIYRSCTTADVIQQECDPPNISIDIDKAAGFYCSLTCSGDGCNRHLVDEIKSTTNDSFRNKCILLHAISLLSVFYLRYNGHS